jgi:hypothetical protein
LLAARGVLTRARMKIFLLAFALVAGCSGGKANVSDEAIDVPTDLKSDLWKRTQLLGNFATNTKSVSASYHNPPRYRSFSFNAEGSKQVDIWIRSTDGSGDSVAWLFDYRGKRLGYNDDADGSTTDSHIHATLPANGNGFWYVYFREYSLSDATFQIQANVGYDGGFIGDVESAWDGLASPDADAVDRSALPAAAQAQFDANNARIAGAQGYALTVDGQQVFAVFGGNGDYGWLDVFGADGSFVVHGECGDGGTSVTAWGGAQGPHY